MIPKTSPHKTKRQLKQAHYRAHRSTARAEAYRLDGGRCVWPTCRRFVVLDGDDPFRLANAHELNGGRAKVDPCDVAQVVTTCFECHMHMHPRIGGKKKRIDATAYGRFGRLEFFERQRDDAWVNVGGRDADAVPVGYRFIDGLAE